MPVAIGYVRVSRPPRKKELAAADTTGAQEASIRAYCAFKGFELRDVVTDDAVSAGLPLAKRKGGQRIVAAVERREVGAVVAVKLDRLFRSVTDCLDTTRAWDTAKVGMHLVDQGGTSIDSTTTLGRFLLTLLSAIGEMERSLTSDRTKAVLAHKRDRGERSTGRAPYGFCFHTEGEGEEKRTLLVPDGDEQRVVARIAAMVADDLSIRAIADRLNATHTPARGAKQWHPTAVARVLQREQKLRAERSLRAETRAT